MQERWNSAAKRGFDIFFSLVGLILLAPILLVLALVIYVDSGRPVLFLQPRLGRGGREFLLYKFRTMCQGAQARGPGCTPAGDRRITSVGRYLRKAKLDELPQLLNVLRGEMSLVGPRPELPRFVQRYPQEYKKILGVRPGITDLASIKFRQESALLKQAPDLEERYLCDVLPQKIKYNLEYIEHQGFLYDLGLILKTLYHLILHPRADAVDRKEA